MAREPHDGAVHLPPVANWYRLLVSNAWQVDQIFQELQYVRLAVGASLRARQHLIENNDLIRRGWSDLLRGSYHVATGSPRADDPDADGGICVCDALGAAALL